MKPTPSAKALDRGNELARIQAHAQALARLDGVAISGGWVRVKISDAIDTIRKIGGGAVGPGGVGGSTMPEALRLAMDDPKAEQIRLKAPPPSPAAITNADRVMTWMTLVPGDFERRVILLRATNFTWREIAIRAGRVPKTCRYWEGVAVERLAARLDGRADPFSTLRGRQGGPGRPPAGSR